MTEEEALDGFPLHPRMRAALKELMGQAAPMPKGSAQQTRLNLLERKWISHVAPGYKPTYVTTKEGMTALEIDAIAVKRLGEKFEGTTMDRSGAYKNLAERLKFLQTLAQAKS
jgi:hypothetical protein